MDAKSQTARPGEGRLPEMAPLANPYVPYQLENTPKYEARKGLIRGTLYPGLDLPFMNMVNQKEKPITPGTELQALGFAVHELALYLDTHPHDKEALEVYQTYQQMFENAKMKYSQEYGPLNHMVPTNGKRYTWPKDPWPWEYVVNKEE